ncbi:transferase 2, rSAM/selenodomain-associated [Fontimonas thermophila]|uniref:Transferase 2, rSAM/selenodomain-associated n=1 Tax=Fontimonas thermophila TaxID=1076937 RepID=A0A1I2KK06_9GAMM|nr:TIGR04283 family arsenosugar biosynthesis glycosyltransferase [Fontimonas thermophila]SFF66668.1 transferase 2, rSAM/selenodomain-associated [Fontimonas thermophila]
MGRVSIIVPMLNEAAVLSDLCEHLAPLARSGVEILFVDGGSQDGSDAIARAAGFCVLMSAAGRARQMNAGARAARGDVLLFLHADTRLPDGAVPAVEAALQSHLWGRFDVRIEGRSWMLRVVAALMNLRSRLTGIATGDQTLFMTRSAYEAVGGFPDQPLMEDIEISRSLKRLGPPACLRLRVTTSGRRWETRGVWRTIVLMWWLRWRYWRGVPAEVLARAYR